MVNLLEGPPDVIVMLEVRSRRKLAELINRAFASVDSIAKGMQVLPLLTRQSM